MANNSASKCLKRWLMGSCGVVMACLPSMAIATEGKPTVSVPHYHPIAVTPIYVPPPQSPEPVTAEEGQPKSNQDSQDLYQWRSREKDSPLEVAPSGISNISPVTPVTAPSLSPDRVYLQDILVLRPLMVKPVTSIYDLEDRAFAPFTFSNWEGEIAYRVFAPLRTPEEEKTIRNLFPQSFARKYGQNPVLQVGLYQDYSNAEQVLSTLRSMNIVAFIVEP